MTNEQIIRMAREAGFSINDGIVMGGVSDLERFADLVAAHEREACAKVCDEQFKKYGCVADKCAVAIRARGEK